jgi:hypothetical protein
MKAEQADGKGRRAGDWHSFIKRQKRREERRKAKRDLDYRPIYNRYCGWET